jgi:hypothetical protein
MAEIMGVQKFEKLQGIIRDDYRELYNALDLRENEIREEVMMIVKKELGIYDLYVQKSKLELQSDEIKSRLKEWEKSDYTNNHCSKLDIAIEEKMKHVTNGERTKIEDAEKHAMRQLTITAVDADIRQVLNDMYEQVKDLKDHIRCLPPIKDKIKAIGAIKPTKKAKRVRK